MGDLKCLMCSKHCLPRQNDTEKTSALQFNSDYEDGNIKNQLQVFYLIRKILELPKNICCNFLQDFGDPCLWYCICPSCLILVEKSRRIFDQILILTQRYENLRAKIKSTIILSVNSEKIDTENVQKCGVREIIRSFVGKAYHFSNTSSTDLADKQGANINTYDHDDSSSSPVTPTSPSFTEDWDIVDEPLLKNEMEVINNNDDPGNELESELGNDISNKNSSDPSSDRPSFLNGLEKSNKKVSVWFYFTKDGNDSARCNEQCCQKILKTCDGSTSGLHAHLRRKHNIDLLAKKKINAANISDDIDDGGDCEFQEKNPCNSQKSQTMKTSKSSLHSKIMHSKNLMRRIRPEKEMNNCEGDSLECEICDKSFSCFSSLSRHIRLHKYREKTYKCDVCGKCFGQKSGLKDHLKTHTGEKPFVCDICGASCSLASNLKKHVIRMHGDDTTGEDKAERKYAIDGSGKRTPKEKLGLTCEVCQKPFTNSNKLKNHILTHTGVKPYQCDICGKSYSKTSHLKDHQMSHTGEKPFVCNVCGNGFGCSSNLKKHIRTHTGEKPFECTTCGKSFVQAGNLNSHLRVHTKEKPYKCDICGKCFVKSDYLKSHANFHTGEKPYTCEVCGKSFSAPNYLRKHLKRPHSKTAT